MKPYGYAEFGSGEVVCVNCRHNDTGYHQQGCLTATRESTAEAMARALERLAGSDQRHRDCDCDFCLGRAALASWRGLTRRER